MPDYIDDPPDVLASLRSICLDLPEAYEEQAWAGTRWRIRRHTFAHVRTADTDGGPVTWLKFRSRGPELDALLALGHPFGPGGFGPDVVAMIIDGGTDWTEVAELLTESYRLFAPKRLAALATVKGPRTTRPHRPSARAHEQPPASRRPTGPHRTGSLPGEGPAV